MESLFFIFIRKCDVNFMATDPIRKNNVNIIGKRESNNTMIFAHGFGTDQTAWNDVYPAFEDEYKIVLYDNVGAGKSAPEAFSPNKYDSLTSYSTDLLDICATLNVKDAIMVGHSVSGMISMLAAIKEPQRFKKMVLIGASARYLNDDDGYVGGFTQEALDGLFQTMTSNYYAWVSGFAPAAMGNADKPKLTERFADTLSAIRPDIAQSVAKVIFLSDQRQQVAKNHIETLLIQTKQDIAVPMEAAEYLHNNMENSELVVVDAEGHFPHISAPQEVIREIKNFL